MSLVVNPDVLDQLAQRIAGGETPEQAARSLRLQGAPLQAVQEVTAEWKQQALSLRTAPSPSALIGPDTVPAPWYIRAPLRSKRWSAVSSRLMTGLDTEAVGSIDAAATKIVSLLNAPGTASFSSRGLVLGNVQSGKTTNFIAVAAKAADAGYRMIVVLSGTSDNLRRQTQERIEHVLIGSDPSWAMLTTMDDDFTSDPRSATGTLLARGKVVVVIVKKQADRLRALCDWIDGAGAVLMKKTPMLVIDDEADSASLDVGEGHKPSTINALLARLLRQQRAAYLAYTATPFANLLTDARDPEGLYPRDFLVDLPAPAGYFGAERVFGRDGLEGETDAAHDGLDVIRTVSDAEAAVVRSVDTDHIALAVAVPALAGAIRWFILATAARRARWGTLDHSTMLVHTSMETVRHTAMAAVVEQVLGGIRSAVLAADLAELAALRQHWEDEQHKVDASQFGHAPIPFDLLEEHLAPVIEAIRLVIDNYHSIDRLRYRDDEPTVAIVIGGNTLSRGLTLEGLCSSYFVRTSKTYDTLMQMGRWFGYRIGYEDLWRSWMPNSLADWFRDLALVEAEIRLEIRDANAEGATPERVGVRIRLHPAMAVTSASKARFAVTARMSYSRSRPQTILFKRMDAAWLRHNIDSARRLTADVTAGGLDLSTFTGGRVGYRGVPAQPVLDFLTRYSVHERTQSMRADTLDAYIRNELDLGALTAWSIVFMSPPVAPGTTSKRRTIDLGIGVDLTLATRSRLCSSDPQTANLKSITSASDRIGDLDIGPAEALSLLGDASQQFTDRAFLQVREHLQLANGVLGIYPIDGGSMPDPSRAKGRGERRVPLEAAEHLVGISLFFPQGTEPDNGVAYVVAPADVGGGVDAGA